MKTAVLSALTFAWIAAAQAQDVAREAMPAPPPIEPSSLFTIPTSRVVRSMDLDLSGSGIFFGGKVPLPPARAVLGLGDIAEIEVGTLEILSSLNGTSRLKSVPSGGLKVGIQLRKYGQGLAASFRKSDTYEEQLQGQEYRAKVGELYVVASVANFPDPEAGVDPEGGWWGIKAKTHFGANYLDANLRTDQLRAQKSLWRPVAGLEVWRNDSRARIVAELGWVPEFGAQNGGQVSAVQVVTGGVRFFFSKHVTLDVGVRHQSDQGGLSESMIQSKLHMSIPTHILRERVVGR
jgi:hypothetical protein